MKIVRAVSDPLRLVVLDVVPDLTRDAERSHPRLDRCSKILRAEGLPFEASGLKQTCDGLAQGVLAEDAVLRVVRGENGFTFPLANGFCE
jgi:hypothetical protein